MDRKNILWLVSWYPNRNDAFDGDFIQRHARAAARYNNIHVIFVTETNINQPIEEDRYDTAGLTEQFIYFRKRKGLFKKVQKQLTWRALFLKAVYNYIREKGKPHLLHVHVPWKAGIIALHFKRKFNLSFIITEHWGIYNTVVEDNIQKKPFVIKRLIKRIFKYSELFTSPSSFLARSVNELLLRKDHIIIPNVVDTSLFYFIEDRNPKFTFIHVSNMVPLKNIQGILKAVQELVIIHGMRDFQVILIGNRDNTYEQQAQLLGLLNKYVFFKGEIPYAAVAGEMQEAHVFILNSVMENSPCVIGEALCCGLPVIATRVGGIPELINSTNGILIDPNNEKALSAAMLQSIDNYARYKLPEIAENAKAKFSFATVGQQFNKLYETQPR